MSFEGSLHSVPARLVRPGQSTKARVAPTHLTLHAPAPTADRPGLLATHKRAEARGSWIIDEIDWDGMPDGHTCATTTEDTGRIAEVESRPAEDSLAALLACTCTAAARLSHTTRQPACRSLE
ncbi:hypothetical protein ACFXPT_38430 [Streptomyces goshikiensis]|uniref:hypothetical protein n=1 Tax=Streptomyces goshikiensis TaxID=1942 RepID=UPI00369642D5